MHLVHAVLAVKGSVAAQQKVSDNAQSPHVDWLAVARLLENLWGLLRKENLQLEGKGINNGSSIKSGRFVNLLNRLFSSIQACSNRADWNQRLESGLGE